MMAVPIRQRQERMRDREGDVHMRHVEPFSLARVEPIRTVCRMARFGHWSSAPASRRVEPWLETAGGGEKPA
jgi:hypothetical protein